MSIFTEDCGACEYEMRRRIMEKIAKRLSGIANECKRRRHPRLTYEQYMELMVKEGVLMELSLSIQTGEFEKGMMIADE